MFDYVCVFTTGGVLLWQNQVFADFNFSIINLFVKTCLLENSALAQQQKRFTYEDYALRWTVQPELKLVFCTVYKEILHLAFVEQFLEMVSKAFIGSAYPKLTRQGDVYISIGAEELFLPQYNLVLAKWD